MGTHYAVLSNSLHPQVLLCVQFIAEYRLKQQILIKTKAPLVTMITMVQAYHLVGGDQHKHENTANTGEIIDQ